MRMGIGIWIVPVAKFNMKSLFPDGREAFLCRGMFKFGFSGEGENETVGTGVLDGPQISLT